MAKVLAVMASDYHSDVIIRETDNGLELKIIGIGADSYELTRPNLIELRDTIIEYLNRPI